MSYDSRILDRVSIQRTQTDNSETHNHIFCDEKNSKSEKNSNAPSGSVIAVGVPAAAAEARGSEAAAPRSSSALLCLLLRPLLSRGGPDEGAGGADGLAPQGHRQRHGRLLRRSVVVVDLGLWLRRFLLRE